MEYRSALRKLLQQVYQAELDLETSLSEKERTVSGDLYQWGFKEIIAHNAFWNKFLIQNILKAKSGEAPEPDDNYLEINDQNFAAFSQMTWPEIQQLSEQTQCAALELVQALSEEDLRNEQFIPDRQEAPLWQQIVSTCVTHSIFHLSDFYMRTGDLEQANRLQEETAHSLVDLDPSESWQSVVIYNLACHHALTGKKEKAIRGLQKALSLNPGLIEWSKQDTDLDSLRQENEYQALYQ